LFFLYPVFQIATLFILTLAANTSYSDFPRLSSLLARDHFLPHQFAFRGDRLAFSTGIICLAVLASLLLILFNGVTTLLINLYAVGVFLSFTLSQAGMVRHWWRLRAVHRGWRRSMIINGVGALATLLVAMIIAVTKFAEGAWIVVVLIPLLVLLFLAIQKHYTYVERERTTEIPLHPGAIQHRLLIPVNILNPVVQESIAYARSISPRVTALHVNMDAAQTAVLRDAWERWQASLPEAERVSLEVIEPCRHSLVRSLVGHIRALQRQYPGETLTVILPEVAVSSALKRLLLHPRTFRLKTALFFHPEIVVTNMQRDQLAKTQPVRATALRHRFIVPLAELDRPSVQSLAYARSISPQVVAVHVAIDPHDAEIIREKWERVRKHLSQEEETHLVIIESPYRSLAGPLLAYIETMRKLHPDEIVTVILPQFVAVHWWEYPLHNQTALQLKTALLHHPNSVVTDIPQHLQKRSQPG
ncbi:MAG: amino acid permease, partial [Ktedonobacteraceae bacterium]|nr:amino acid permease [Ktedonobacteraceae bacterium]